MPPCLSDTSVATNSPISSAVANLSQQKQQLTHLPTGVRIVHSAAHCLAVSSGGLAIMSVATYPGEIAFTVIPSAAHSTARLWGQTDRRLNHLGHGGDCRLAGVVRRLALRRHGHQGGDGRDEQDLLASGSLCRDPRASERAGEEEAAKGVHLEDVAKVVFHQRTVVTYGQCSPQRSSTTQSQRSIWLCRLVGRMSSPPP